MTPMERVLATLSHKEPDRVPFFLLVTMHGAKELGMSLKEYFSKGENAAEGQVRMQKKYGHDCLYALFYASIEIEAWGGEVIFSENGPANSGQPLIKNYDDIKMLEPPVIKDSPRLLEVLKAIQIMKEKAGNTIPIIGIVVSPFSLPVMQMGFHKYFELMYEQPELFKRLMKINEEFCVEWANAQLAAGVTAMGYFDPVSSATISTRDFFLKSGFTIAQRTISRINGPVAMHFASGRCLPIIDDIAQTGAAAIGAGNFEDMGAIKAACKGRISVMGNLNGIKMRRWTPEEAEAAVRDAILKGGPGGGFILSDSHGEIPFQVPEKTLLTLSESVRKWGAYPIHEK
ncbi:MAG: methylcobamide--CoM methyltransferase MtbA [bacterium]|nr:methylcobamide--CoM methyltransferase MtbA [bacterium]